MMMRAIDLEDEEGDGDDDEDHADEQVEDKNIDAITLLVRPAHHDNSGHEDDHIMMMMPMMITIMAMMIMMMMKMIMIIWPSLADAINNEGESGKADEDVTKSGQTFKKDDDSDKVYEDYEDYED